MSESTGPADINGSGAALSPSPRPLTSLLASAQRLTTKKLRRTLGSPGAGQHGWQDDAWDMFDLVGEERFLATTLAGRIGQARLYVGRIDSADATEAPEPVDDEKLTAILDAFGASPAGRAQILTRLAINLFVAGDGWIVGIPNALFPEGVGPGVSLDPERMAQEREEAEALPLAETDIADLEWRMLSVSEVSSTAGDKIAITLGVNEGEKIVCSPDDVVMIRVWRPHPRRYWEADSPTRSSLPVLRELVGLTMHISAQVDSRLAGAGLLIVPQSAKRAINVAAGISEDEADDADPFTEALMEAMLRPIEDRSNASALVPLVVTVPDDVTEKFVYMTFAKPLDNEARSLRDEAIRRLALGQDAPPELLLGTAGMNHWGAWLVREDVVTTHIEPPLALICDALTTQYLWPVLMDQGYDEARAHEYVIWFDVSDMVSRPNRSADALELQGRGVISDKALRDATGFDDSDAPAASSDPAIGLALELVKGSPTLAASPGIPNLVEQIRAVMEGRTDVALPESVPSPAEEVEPPASPDAPPQTDTAPAPEPGVPDAIAASAPMRVTGNARVLPVDPDLVPVS